MLNVSMTCLWRNVYTLPPQPSCRPHPCSHHFQSEVWCRIMSRLAQPRFGYWGYTGTDQMRGVIVDPRLQVVLFVVFEGSLWLIAVLVLRERLEVRIVCGGNLSTGRVVRRMVRGRGRLEGLGRGRVNCRQTVETWGGTLQQELSEYRRGLELEVRLLHLCVCLDEGRLTFVILWRTDTSMLLQK